MSIKFPDLQVLFPRAHDTSRAEQVNQRQADITQAQMATQAGDEVIAKRRQVVAAEKQTYGRIGEREAGGRERSFQSGDEKPQDQSDEGKTDVPTNLGRKIDIRI